jgi:hypothetical protein
MQNVKHPMDKPVHKATNASNTHRCQNHRLSRTESIAKAHLNHHHHHNDAKTTTCHKPKKRKSPGIAQSIVPPMMQWMNGKIWKYLQNTEYGWNARKLRMLRILATMALEPK